jgi:hypothetical protein
MRSPSAYLAFLVLLSSSVASSVACGGAERGEGENAGSCTCDLAVNGTKAKLRCEQSVCLSGRTYTCAQGGLTQVEGCAVQNAPASSSGSETPGRGGGAGGRQRDYA